MHGTKNTDSRADSRIIAAGTLVALAIIAAAVVVLMIGTDATTAVAVLTAFGAVLATIPPIIKALRNDDDARTR